MSVVFAFYEKTSVFTDMSAVKKRIKTLRRDTEICNFKNVMVLKFTRDISLPDGVYYKVINTLSPVF